MGSCCCCCYKGANYASNQTVIFKMSSQHNQIIKTLKQQNEYLQSKVKQLQESNEVKERFEETCTQIVPVVCPNARKVMIAEFRKQTGIQTQNKSKQIENQIDVKNQLQSKQLTEKINRMEEQIRELQNESREKENKLRQANSQLISFAEMSQKIIWGNKWVSSNCSDYKYLKFDLNKVTLDTQAICANVFSSWELSFNFIIILQIVSLSGLADIGIADLANQTKPKEKTNMITFSNNGKLRVNNKQIKDSEQKAFKSGDHIRIEGNLESGLIQWIINGKIACQHEQPTLPRRGIKWVPMVSLWKKGDSFVIIHN